MSKITNILIIIAIALMMVIIGLKVFHRQPEPLNPIVVTDTIERWHSDTSYIIKYDTIKYSDTIVIQNNDTLFIERQAPIPIKRYLYDTVISKPEYMTTINARLSGWNVELEELRTQTTITPQNGDFEPKTRHWYDHLCPAIGIGFGTGGFGIFIGVGFQL